jgi:hypothetical protein
MCNLVVIPQCLHIYDSIFAFPLLVLQPATNIPPAAVRFHISPFPLLRRSFCPHRRRVVLAVILNNAHEKIISDVCILLLVCSLYNCPYIQKLVRRSSLSECPFNNPLSVSHSSVHCVTSFQCPFQLVHLLGSFLSLLSVVGESSRMTVAMESFFDSVYLIADSSIFLMPVQSYWSVLREYRVLEIFLRDARHVAHSRHSKHLQKPLQSSRFLGLLSGVRDGIAGRSGRLRVRTIT